MRSVVLASLLVAAPLSAQEAPAPSAPTAAQDLDCALWASFTLGSSTDPKLVTGLSVAVAWFTGLYEGKTGKSINAALKARADILTEAEVQALGPACIARMETFAQRLQAFGE